MYACFAVFICNINKEVVSYFACTYISITKERPARELTLFYLLACIICYFVIKNEEICNK